MHRTIKHLFLVFVILALGLVSSFVVVPPRPAQAAVDCNAGVAIIGVSVNPGISPGSVSVKAEVSNTLERECAVQITYYANVTYAPTGLTYFASQSLVWAIAPGGIVTQATFPIEGEFPPIGVTYSQSTAASALLHHLDPACPFANC